jgi:hypothetical protein
MKLSLSLLSCGKCGKQRGRYHMCRGTRKGRDRLRVKAGFTCKCGKTVTNPFTHTCSERSDFKKRRRAADRAEKTRKRRARRKRVRDEAAARRRAAAKARRAKARATAKARRPRASPHNPRTCKDAECTRYGCVKYREGFVDGVAAGSEGGGDG